MIMKGTGSPMAHPRTKTLRLPTRSINPPANTFAKAFVSPNPTMNEGEGDGRRGYSEILLCNERDRGPF